MNILNSIISNKYLSYPLCFIGGYALSSASARLNQLAVKHFHLPIDILNHQNYDNYSNSNQANMITLSMSGGYEGERLDGITLWRLMTQGAVREEISFRFLLETIVLPRISSQFATFSIARTCISSLLFASTHLRMEHYSREQLAGNFINTLLVGVICSFAQERIGLVGSILIHAGYNLCGYRYTFNLELRDVVRHIKAITLKDVINPHDIATFLINFGQDALSPFILTYKASMKVFEHFKTKKLEGQA